MAGGQLILDGVSKALRSSIPLTFVSGQADNPKVCAILVVAGTVEGAVARSLCAYPSPLAEAQEIAPLTEPNVGLREVAEDMDLQDLAGTVAQEDRERRDVKTKSKPKKANPYEEQSTSPVLLVVVGAVIFLAVVAFWLTQSGSSKKAQ